MFKKETQQKEQSVVKEQSMVLVENVQDITTKKMEGLMKLEQERRKLMTDYINRNFKPSVDFITIEFNTKSGGKVKSKPSLSKAGSEKWLSLFHFRAIFKKDVETFEMAGNPTGLFTYICELLNAKGEVIGEGRGAANINEKQNWTANNAIKIAEKRAQIDAVLRTGSLSDFFTQDLEDMNGGKTEKTPFKGREYNPKDKPKMITEEQLKVIFDLTKELGAKDKNDSFGKVCGVMETLYTDWNEITQQEADDIISKLQASLKDREDDNQRVENNHPISERDEKGMPIKDDEIPH
ncbi:hypothetical protein ISS21_01695 [Patescibacteria group bacterium]|nr:hypothetical protein [Patescibacteria group bacterium]